MNNQIDSNSKGKTWIEICLVSARGLPRSSFLKPQWYAVGWIDPNNKYCTKIDASGSTNPVWNTKFTTVIDTSGSDFLELALNVEVYSREPLFLREKLQGTATILLKEFLAKHSKNSESSNKDLGSFQLRKKNSNKPQGFIDVSFRILEEREGTDSYSFLVGSEEGFSLKDNSNSINLAIDAGPMQAYPGGRAKPPFDLPGNPRPPAAPAYPYAHPMPYPGNYSNPSIRGPSYAPARGTSYHPPHTPPPPLPPSNVGYMPTFLPQTNNPSTSYINMPPSGAGRGARPGFGVGVGAGALAAGAVIFGDGLMSGFELPAGLSHPSFAIATDPPF